MSVSDFELIKDLRTQRVEKMAEIGVGKIKDLKTRRVIGVNVK